MAASENQGAMQFFDRRTQRRQIKERATELQHRVSALRAEVAASALAVRGEFENLAGFPPGCERCGTVMLYRRVQLGRKKWRWQWACQNCGYRVYDAALKARDKGA